MCASEQPRHFETVIMTMGTPGFDGALPHNLRMVAAATAAVVG